MAGASSPGLESETGKPAGQAVGGSKRDEHTSVWGKILQKFCRLLELFRWIAVGTTALTDPQLDPFMS